MPKYCKPPTAFKAFNNDYDDITFNEFEYINLKILTPFVFINLNDYDDFVDVEVPSETVTGRRKVTFNENVQLAHYVTGTQLCEVRRSTRKKNLQNFGFPAALENKDYVSYLGPDPSIPNLGGCSKLRRYRDQR